MGRWYLYVMPELAVPWFRLLVGGLLPQSPGFAPELNHVRFVVDNVALGTGFSPSSPCKYHSTVFLRTHVSSGG
jgi:hypothetical protein